jgi:D-proline reductase (dithiol) PrdB
MVRLADLPENDREHHLARLKIMPQLDCPKLVGGVSLSQRRVAIITTAGIHRRGEQAYDAQGSGVDYRVIPATTAEEDLVMSHVSVNFDRTGFQSDFNVVFPIDRLKELAASKLIGSVANFHYSFMGAIWPITRYETRVRALAALLKQDRVDAVILSPV